MDEIARQIRKIWRAMPPSMRRKGRRQLNKQVKRQIDRRIR